MYLSFDEFGISCTPNPYIIYGHGYSQSGSAYKQCCNAYSQSGSAYKQCCNAYSQSGSAHKQCCNAYSQSGHISRKMAYAEPQNFLGNIYLRGGGTDNILTLHEVVEMIHFFA